MSMFAILHAPLAVSRATRSLLSSKLCIWQCLLVAPIVVFLEPEFLTEAVHFWNAQAQEIRLQHLPRETHRHHCDRPQLTTDSLRVVQAASSIMSPVF